MQTSLGNPQASGIGQVHRAVADMDSVTQHNGTLVEESAAATESMKEQAARLAQLVAVFKLDDKPARAEARQAARPAPRIAKAASPAKAPAAAATKAEPSATTGKREAPPVPPKRAKPAEPPVARARAKAAAEESWEEF